MIKSYLRLFRIPGIFTAFSNILLGFFVIGDVLDWFSLVMLFITSGLLFLSGMTLNDYFDFNIDKKERPQRPLPSNEIPKERALKLGIVFLIIANLIALVVGLESLILSIVMSALIIAYNCKIKKLQFWGILNLSSIRFLNVVLGSSVVLGVKIIPFAIPIGIYVAGISILAKGETDVSSKRSELLNTLLIITTIIYVAIVVLDSKNIIPVIFLGIFAASVFIPKFVYREKNGHSSQQKVSFQLLAIIVLDACLISIVSDLLYAVLTLFLYAPAYWLGRKMYLT